VTSSAKKLVLNSTSEAENAIPTDWDASAIIAPGLKGIFAQKTCNFAN
jgi:hypothetical protein